MLKTHKFKKIFLLSGAQVPPSKPPPALAFLAGGCERNKVEYEICDLNVSFIDYAGIDVWTDCYSYSSNCQLDLVPSELSIKIDSFVSWVTLQIKNSGADCVAISLLSHLQQQWAHKFLSQLKTNYPVITIAGGPGCNVPCVFGPNQLDSFGRVMVNCDLLDYYAAGEGDIIFEKFLQGERDLPGLNNKILPETYQPQIDDLNSLPIPSYKKINIKKYQNPEKIAPISITGSRGCVRRCTFCDVGHLWKKFRYRDGDNVAYEIIQHFNDTGIQHFWFTDSLINGNIKQFKKMLEYLVVHKEKYGMNDLSLNGQFIVRSSQSHSEQMYELMSMVGFNNIQIGIESGSAMVREHMGKKFTNQDIDYHFEMCNKYSIKNWLLMIVGYPTETEKDFQDTLDMLSRYQKYLINDTILGMNLTSTCSILPNTPLTLMSENLGIHYLYDSKDSWDWSSSSNPDLTIKERYLRWIKTIRHAINLGYKMQGTLMTDLATNYQRFNNSKDIKNIQKHIPIILEQQNSSAYFS